MSGDGGRQSSQRFRVQATTPEDAAIYDAHVVPRYSSLFGRLLLAKVPSRERIQVLDVGCGTGHPTTEVLARLGEGSRVIAVDPDSELLDVARCRALDDTGRRIFFKCAMAEELAFGNEVFDLVISNLAFGAFVQPERALAEIHRVLIDGGQLLLTHTLAGTFEEVFDVFREIALRRDDAALSSRIERIQGRYPNPETFEAVFTNAGFEQVVVTDEEFQLTFPRATEILADPVIRFVALPEWRWVAGLEDDGKAILREVESTLDTYFGHGPLTLRVRAGLVSARA